MFTIACQSFWTFLRRAAFPFRRKSRRPPPSTDGCWWKGSEASIMPLSVRPDTLPVDTGGLLAYLDRWTPPAMVQSTMDLASEEGRLRLAEDRGARLLVDSLRTQWARQQGVEG